MLKKNMEEIYINEPCPVSWGNMKVSGNGRFCDSCAMVVVDFTNMSNEEISNYFLKQSGQHICGRYRNDQVSTPKLVRRRKRWGWLVTALTIIFGTSFISSCRKHIVTHTQGARAYDFKPAKNANQQNGQNIHF